MEEKVILLTGGTGYIGSHILLELLKDSKYNNHTLVVVDNLSNSNLKNFSRLIRKLDFQKQRVKFHQINLATESDRLEKEIFCCYHVEAIIHLAGLKSVKESIQEPLMYYQNNVVGTLNLLALVKKYCYATPIRFIFSSSATVYGEGCLLPIKEDARKLGGYDRSSGSGPINPYGRTKLILEEILRDLVIEQGSIWKITILRYFNPIGADPNGLVVEDPTGIPENLIPYVVKVIRGELPELNVFGNNYSTPDGTCIRDYIHVVDLAKAHLAALKYDQLSNLEIFNIGTGTGYSVLEVISEFKKLGYSVPWKFAARRPGDSPQVYADSSRAELLLDWKAELGLTEMCRDSIRG